MARPGKPANTASRRSTVAGPPPASRRPGGRAARARAMAIRRWDSPRRSGMEGGLKLLFTLGRRRPQQPEAAQETREVTPEREAKGGRCADFALGVVEMSRESGPRPTHVEAGGLPAVEAVLVAVVGREGARVAGQ